MNTICIISYFDICTGIKITLWVFKHVYNKPRILLSIPKHLKYNTLLVNFTQKIVACFRLSWNIPRNVLTSSTLHIIVSEFNYCLQTIHNLSYCALLTFCLISSRFFQLHFFVTFVFRRFAHSSCWLCVE